MHRTLSLLSAALVLTLLAPAAGSARRIETLSNASSSSSTASSVVKTTGRGSSHRALLRAKRLEWKERAEGNRPLPSSSSSAKSGSFLFAPYTDGVLDEGQSALLFFCGTWSRQCQGMDKLLEEWSEARKFVVPVYRVDYDTAKALRAQYGVRYVNSYAHVDGKGTLIRLYRNPPEATVKHIAYDE
ncbi:MAG: thioredoxin family protein [Candidatus Peribacteraceae bacterium]|jgi:thiol-disulfide isomerase/thioredoxin